MRQFLYLFLSLLVTNVSIFGAEPAPSAAPEPVSAPANATSAAPLTWKEQAAAVKEVTTINEERGNWVMKAKILKDARKVYDQIQKKILSIEPLQEKYLKERTDLDTTMNAFYNDFGVKKGEIDEHLNVINEDLKKLELSKTHVHANLIDEKERLLHDETKRKKDTLEELKKNFDYLQKLEDALSQALITMSAQLNKVISYGEQAWTNYEKIGDILNDEVAQDLLSKMHVMFENMGAIETYLNGELSTFFTNTIQKTKDQVELIKNKIISLKNDGVALGKKMKELIEADEALRLAQEEKKGEKKAEEKIAEKRWFSPIVSAIFWAWEGVKSGFSYLYEAITGWLNKKPEKKIPEPVEQKAVEQEAAEEKVEQTAHDQNSTQEAEQEVKIPIEEDKAEVSVVESEPVPVAVEHMQEDQIEAEAHSPVSQ